MKKLIDIFDRLNDIAERRGITTVEWATSSGVPQPRIAELRNLSKLVKVLPDHRTGRACSFEKLNSLLIGLRKILGDKYIVDELKKKAETETDIDTQLMYYELIMNSSSPKKKLRTIEGIKRVLDDQDE